MTFRTVLMDPPWPERGGGKITRGAQKHYELIGSKAELLETVIMAEPWRELDRTSAHIYMWATDNYLTWALWLFEALGAKHHRCIPWIKHRMGLGQYFRGCHELLLFGTFGKGMAACRDQTRESPEACRTDYLVLPNRPPGKIVHSAKPSQQYELIERRSQGAYLEMFARSERAGWTAWGNEVGS